MDRGPCRLIGDIPALYVFFPVRAFGTRFSLFGEFEREGGD